MNINNTEKVSQKKDSIDNIRCLSNDREVQKQGLGQLVLVRGPLVWYLRKKC